MTNIKQAQKNNEKTILSLVKRCNKIGEGYRPQLLSVSLYNAIDRLREAGKIRYSKTYRTNYLHTGYWVK